MSAIPSSAMPHAFAHDDDESNGSENATATLPSRGVLIGGAVAAYLLYRILR